MTWIIKNVNRIPTHCGVAHESVHSLARGHVIRVCLQARQAEDGDQYTYTLKHHSHIVNYLIISSCKIGKLCLIIHAYHIGWVCLVCLSLAKPIYQLAIGSYTCDDINA